MTERTCDVLVLGAGGAGLVAGVRAAEAGKKVIILEKSGFLGGGMLLASTMRIFGSKWQERRGIPNIAYDYLRRAMDITRWKLDPKLAKNAIFATGEFFDWYEEHETEDVLAQYKEGHYVFDEPEFTQICPEAGGFHWGSGDFFMKCMIRYGEELGVEMLTNHAGKRPIIKDGKIAAIIADTPDGEVQFNCDTCVLATCSWINDTELMKQVEPRFLEADVQKNAHRNKAYTGDALKIAREVGAFIDQESFCLRLMGPHAATGDRSDLDNLGHSPYIVLVNELGNRFIAEPIAPRIDPFVTGHILLEQPHAKAYFIYSKDMLETMIAATQGKGEKADEDVFGMPPLPPYEVIEGWFDAAIAKNKGLAVRGDTVEEAAEKMGIDPQALAKTVADYNKSCDEGLDWNFFKEPQNMAAMKEGPYFIVSGQLSTDGAFGGIKVNENMQAYAANGVDLVDGLYVVGDAAAGRFIVDSGIKKQLINDMSWAIASGFIAGNVIGKK